METLKKKLNKFPDRANLNPRLSKRLEDWVHQIHQETNNAVRVSKSDLVDYFLNLLPDKLDTTEVIKIEIKFFNEAKWLAWAVEQIKESKRGGHSLCLQDLLNQKNSRWGSRIEAIHSDGIAGSTKRPYKKRTAAQSILESPDIELTTKEILNEKAQEA